MLLINRQPVLVCTIQTLSCVYTQVRCDSRYTRMVRQAHTRLISNVQVIYAHIRTRTGTVRTDAYSTTRTYTYGTVSQYLRYGAYSTDRYVQIRVAPRYYPTVPTVRRARKATLL